MKHGASPDQARTREGGRTVAQYIYTLEKARKAHGDKVVLDDVTLSFLPGAKIGVVGPNGAGKSSLLRIMAGQDRPSNGEARLMPGYTVGLLSQEPPLNEDKDVLVERRLLREQADGVAGHQPGLAVAGAVLARHDPQQAGLAGAVGTDDADLRARQERECHVIEHDFV